MNRKCPTCGNSLQGGSAAKNKDSQNPFFPFCSLRCRMADLNSWFEGEYKVIENDDEDYFDDIES